MLELGFVDLAYQSARGPRPANHLRALTWLTFAALLLAISSGPAAATKIEIEGATDAMQLSAEDAPLGEVLAALAARFNLTYEPAPQLDRQVGGTYSGTLQQVLVRILDGYDYVTNFSADGIELKVWGSSQIIQYPRPGATSVPIANQVPMLPGSIRPSGIPGQMPANAQAAVQ